MKRIDTVAAWIGAAMVILAVGCADSSMGGAALTLGDADSVNSSTTDGTKGGLDGGASWDGEFEATATAQDSSETPTDESSGWKGGGIGLTLPGAQNTGKFRAQVAAGKVPQPSDFPMAGWLNEHHAVLPPANPANDVDLHPIASLHSTATGATEVLLQLGLNTSKTLQELQPPVAMVLLVDKSGSLGVAGWQTLQQQIPQIAERLPEGSWLSVVGFSSGAETAWPMAAWHSWQTKALGVAVQGMEMGDGTDLYVGVEGALKELAKAPPAFVQRRVLLISDGAITKGEHTPTDVVELAKGSKASFSTVAYGMDAQVKLLEKLALVTSGTSYSAVSPAALVDALSKHVATLLVAVAENLGVRLKLSAGWKVVEYYELPLVEQGDTLTLGDSANQQGSTDVSAGASDASQPSQDTVMNPPDVKFKSVYPASHNGLIVLKIAPPAGLTLSTSTDLIAAKVDWTYALTKNHVPKSHESAIKVLGLVAIPDGGYEYFSHPEARRTYAIVTAGEALKAAVVAAAAGKVKDGQAKLNAAATLVAATIVAVDVKTADPAGDLADAQSLLAKLAENLNALGAKAP